MAARTSRPGISDGPQWFDAAPAPLVLVSGPESLLASRAVERIVAAVKKREGSVDVTRLDAAAYTAGALRAAASPSLFAEPSVVVIDSAETMNDEFLADALSYVAAPDPDVTVVIVHGGGVRGKKLLDALKASGAPVYSCAAIKKDADLVDFAMGEFKRAGRAAAAQAVRALVNAVGNDVAQVAAACAQLVADVETGITEEIVAKYYGSRVNATGFAVADAAIIGQTGEALALVRHAIETGTDPVPLVAALASKLRTLAKVAASRGRGVDLQLAPWQIEKARKDLRFWDADRLAAAIEAVAAADHEIKGASRAPGFALERAVRRVAELAAN